MMKSKVYVETTIVSYLVAGPTKDIIQAAHQQITRQWWASRDRFDVFVSRPVVAEARRGDAKAAARAFGFFGASPGWPVAAAGPSWRRRYFVREHCRKGLKSTRCTLGLRRSTGSTTY